MSGVMKIAVGGYAIKCISDAEIKLHNYEDGVEGVVVDSDNVDLDAILIARVRGVNKVDIYSTLSGHYSSSKVPAIVKVLKKMGIPVNLMILTLPNQIRSLLRSDLSRPRLEVISADDARCDIAFVESLKTHASRGYGLAEEIREMVASFRSLSQLDVEAAVSRARKILEVVVTEMYRTQFPGQTTKPLFNMIEDLAAGIPRRIHTYFHTIRVVGNLSVHYAPESPEMVTPNDVRVIGTLVTAITEWFILEADAKTN